jgi:hypothetical protein
MKVNVWHVTAFCPRDRRIETLYYSENLNQSVEYSNMVCNDISSLRNDEGCSIESSHYGYFEYSKVQAIANKVFMGRLFCVD